MKKRYFTLIPAALTAALLCACGQQAAQPTASNVLQQESSAQTSVEGKAVIIETCDQEGTGKDSDGNTYPYAYHVPQIDDDTPGATSINEEISQFYGVLADVSLEEIERGGPPGCSTIAYESYRRGDILCLVMKCTYYYDGFEECNTYSYNVRSGERLTNADLLKQLNVTEAQYLDALRRAAAQCYDNLHFSTWKKMGLDPLSGDYQERRSWTISEKNINLDLPLYLDNDGTVHTITPIGSHVDPEWLYETLTPDLNPKDADVQINNTFPGLTVTSQGQTVSLTFHKIADGAVTENPDVEIPYEKAIPVDGLYGDYTKIFCASGGDTNILYVFLLTEEGRVDYVNVSACLESGCFCGSGPLLGAAGITDFTTAENEAGIQWIYGVTDNGKQIDLLDLAIAEQLCIPTAFAGSWSIFADDSPQFLSLELAPGNGDNLNLTRVDGDTRLEAYGLLPYQGMTEQGMIYTYHVESNASDGPDMTGVAALELASTADDLSLSVTELGGTPLLGTKTGDTTVLMKTYG